MKFSLIIGTLNRDKLLKQCIDSLLNQNYNNFEIIIIDQSDNDLTKKMVKEVNDDRIVYNHVDYKGLSKARNDALKQVTGDYFCLIDDDAFYYPNYLKMAYSLLKKEKTIISGYIFDKINNKDFVKYNNSKSDKYVEVRDIMRTCPSPALIFPVSIIKEIGFFDEKFGVGSLYGAGEETDYLLRAYYNNYKIKYNRNLRVDHPMIIEGEPPLIMTDKKIASYAYGTGALLKKHMIYNRNHKLVFILFEFIAKNIIKSFIYSKKGFLQVRFLIKGFNDYCG